MRPYSNGFPIAHQLLDDTEVPLGQIAAALDYSEASTFTRAFRRWSGEIPTAWRAKYRRNRQGTLVTGRGLSEFHPAEALKYQF